MAQLTIQQAFDLARQHHQAGRLREAEQVYRQILAVHPKHAEAHGNLGIALKAQGRLDEAIAEYRALIALMPESPEAHYNLGNALQAKDRLDEAIAAYRRALALRPGFLEAYGNLGRALSDAGQLQEAIGVLQRAAALQPGRAEAHFNLGVALRDHGRVDEAVAAYRQAIVLQANYPEAWDNLGNALKDKGQLDAAIAAYRRAMALAPDNARSHSNLVYAMLFHPAFGAREIAEEHRRWAARHAEPLRRRIQPHLNEPAPDRRLKIGYVSPDFRDHVVGRNLVPLLGRHDRRQFEITCYADVSRPDVLTGEFRKNADRWRDIVGLSDEQVTEQIREDEIDILVDLALHMAGNRLLVFARRPAPVQVTFAGYPGSTGLNTIDYRLTDPHLDPPGPPPLNDRWYAEESIRLPDTFWCYDPPDARDLPVSSLPALKTGVVTFGCLNNFCKVNDGTLALWARVLGQVAGSRLLLLARPGDHQKRAVDFLGRRGIAPERVEFLDLRPRRAYMEIYYRIDIGLDSLPYNGHTTSLDSFWMGVPVVTLAGNTVVGRAGLSQLTNLGLRELAATTAEEFVEVATRLAGDLARLQALRETLRERMKGSALMDAPRFAGAIEAAYREMWRKWCATESPASPGPDRVVEMARLKSEAEDKQGMTLREAGRVEEAIAAHRQAIALDPGFAAAHSHLGIALSAAGKFDEAVAAFRQAIALMPENAEAQSNLGAALKEQGQFAQAIAACRQAIALKPDYPRALYNLGNALTDGGWLSEAIASYQRALALQPDFVECHFNLGFACLLRGDFGPGWREFEWRMQSRDFALPPGSGQGLWDGSDLNGRTILLRAEQGFGDTLQFIRYVPLVAQRGGQVIVECPPALSGLLRGIDGIDLCVTCGETLPPFDVHCPLLSLPLRFETTLENIPARVPYVFADAQQAMAWSRRLGQDQAALKVGLAWAGNPLYRNDRMRSPRRLSLLAPLAQAANVSFYSLQKGGTQAQPPPAGLRLTDWSQELNDFSDTAALIANLDLVISSDTAVAHLAGAMGKPVWVMLPFAPDWRWMVERADSPWYPTMRLFRQAKIGDWDEVARRVAEALSDFARDSSHTGG